MKCKHCGAVLEGDPDPCEWGGELDAENRAPCGAVIVVDDAEYVPHDHLQAAMIWSDDDEWKAVVETLTCVKSRGDAYELAASCGLNPRMVKKWIEENGL